MIKSSKRKIKVSQNMHLEDDLDLTLKTLYKTPNSYNSKLNI